jgi:hypothetical protein
LRNRGGAEPPPVKAAETELPLEVKLAEMHAALARLQTRIREACGPDHEYVKLRADGFPTCPHCHVTGGGMV